MAEKVTIQVKEQNPITIRVQEQPPMVIRMAKQGAIGRPGPIGERGKDGITWELLLTMTGAPDGICSMALYRNGIMYNAKPYFAYVETLAYDANEFVYRSEYSNNVLGSCSFNYTNVRSILVTAYEDSSMEKAICANSCNYGKAASVTVGNVTHGAVPSVTNVGTPFDAVLDFQMEKGDAATIRVGQTTTLPFGANATVTNVGTANDAIFNFGIPNGAGSGARVEEVENLIFEAGSLYIPSLSSDGILSWTNNSSQPNPNPVRITINPKGDWSNLSQYYRLDVVRYNGSSYFAKMDVPAGTAVTNATYWMKMVDKGDAATVTVGTVTTGAAGTNVSVTNRGTSNNAILDFTIPRGAKGDTATVAVGTVTTGTPSTPASVVNSGTQNDAIFDFTIPQGKASTITIGTVSTGAAGSNATVTNRGTSADAILDFSIPRGENGEGYTGAVVDEPNKLLILERAENLLSDMAFVDDAPENGNKYVRRNGDWESIDSVLNAKAPLASPALTGTPTAPTAAEGTNTTQIATTAFVQAAFKSNDAMVFKGTIGSSGATVTALPNTHYQGWTYKVATAGTYAGQKCEIGDSILCVTDGTTANNAHWTIIQANIDGAVTGDTSSTDAHVAIFNGTSGKSIKDSGFTIGKSVPSDAKFTDTTYTTSTISIGSASAGTAISADDITAWSAGSTPTLGTAIPADDITAWSAGTTPTLGTAIPADDITAWSAGALPTATVANGILTFSMGTLPSLSYTAKSIPNVTSVGTVPSLSYTAKSIPNVTSVGEAPSLSYTARTIPNISVSSKTVVTGITAQ